MWAEACAMIERAEQMHRQFFQPGLTAVPRAIWEPPVDIFESEHDLLIVVALPGVESDDIEISAGPEILLVAGVRRLPAGAVGMAIQRLEIPHGRFERPRSIELLSTQRSSRLLSAIERVFQCACKTSLQ